MNTSPSSSTTLAAPIYQTPYNNNKLNSSSPQTPTPTSSSSSLEKNKAVRGLSLQISASQKYGSLGSSTPYLESRPVTPSQTTISPNANDEGLYLLWTQQLLREQGFKPSPCRPDEEEYTKKEERDEDDSSVSDMSSVSSDDEDDEGGEEGDSLIIDHYIAEQRKLFSPGPSSLYAYSHRASMISHYSTTNPGVIVENAEITAKDDTLNTTANARRNSTSTFFYNCFPSCL